MELLFIEPAEQHYSGADRSSKPQKQLSAAPSMSLGLAFMKIYTTESTVAQLLVVVVVLVVQTVFIVILVHAILRRNHFVLLQQTGRDDSIKEFSILSPT